MDYLPQVLAAEDGECDITNAFCFSRDAAFILINAESADEDLQASVLLKVDLTRKKVTYQVLHEFDSGSLDYHAETPDLHYILASGGYIHQIRDGAMTHHPFASQAFLPNLARIDETSVAVFGEEGQAFRFRDGAYTPIPTPVTTTLNAMQFLPSGAGAAAGDYGVLLLGGVAGFALQDVSGSESIRALTAAPDGSILLACADGVGLIVRQDEILRAEGPAADFCSVAVFKGVEYWGNDDFGILTRDGATFRPRFETGYAFKMTATPDLLTINAGYAVYIFDGTDWIHLRLNNRADRLIERAPLDFQPQ